MQEAMSIEKHLTGWEETGRIEVHLINGEI
jgi:hypothetical protein